MIVTWRSSRRRPAFASRHARSHTAPPTCPPPCRRSPLPSPRRTQRRPALFPHHRPNISRAYGASTYSPRKSLDDLARTAGAQIRCRRVHSTRAVRCHPPRTCRGAPRSLTGACPASAARHTPFRRARDCEGRGTLDVVSAGMMMSPVWRLPVMP